MANAALLAVNQADTGYISASSQVITMPASAVATPHPSEKWRSKTNNDFLIMAKTSSLSADTYMVKGLNATTAATIRLRLSQFDSSGAAGEVFDGTFGNGSPQFDPSFGQFVWLAPQPMNWRYSRVDIYDPTLTYIEAGAIADGLRTNFEYNFAKNSTIQYIDRSRVSTSAGGQTLTLEDNTFRRIVMNFDWLTEDERYGVIETLQRYCGIRKNVLFITDIESSNLPRSAIYGLITDLTPVTFTDIQDIYGKSIKIDERI
jgi:hypothetical protein